MEKVLVTGITGFVGSHIADYCLEKGVKLFGFKRYHLSNMKNVSHIEDEIIWIDCDMMDMKSVIKSVRECMPDKIFHMASQSFVSPSWDHPHLYMDANYKMTVNILEACIANEINPRILIPGSGEEFGEIYEEELPITESTIIRPVNPYAVSKVAQDLIAYVYYRSYGLNVIRTRAFNHEGPRRDKVFGIPWYAYQIARIENGLQEPVIKVGHIDDKRNFTHVKDMVHGYWLAMEKCTPGELYLIGSEKSNDIHTFREALEKLISLSHVSKITYEIDEKYVRPTQVPFLICDTSKFRALTNWEPTIGFEKILEDTLEHWRYQVKEKLNQKSK
ncbi:MAG: GDP-mannose 4,6-dehydratase [Candidatus Odinarchaeota archaeon]